MTKLEILIWGGCIGVYASYAGLCLFYALRTRVVSALITALFVIVAGHFVFSFSGLALEFFPQWPVSTLQTMQWVGGPVAAAVATFGLRDFLRAEQRDAFVDKGLLLVSLSSLALCLAWVLAPRPLAQEIIALGLVLSAVLTFWLCLRAWLLGDRFAMPMTWACATILFATAGLQVLALGMVRESIGLQVAVALLATLYIMLSCHTIKWRHTEYLRMRKALTMDRDRDLLTKLLTGAALVRKVDEALARAVRNRKEMAVICIEITNTTALRQEFGHHGVEQVIYGVAARIRSIARSASVIGRYSDHSFIVALDSVSKATALRTLGLRLAAQLRKPFMLNPYSTSPREFRVDVGVGVARVALGREQRQKRLPQTQMGGFDSFSIAQDVLHESAELALTARQFASRAAITDAYSRKVVALEAAQLQ
jgi:diguanylate cyclase (GGDEF)-like protein